MAAVMTMDVQREVCLGDIEAIPPGEGRAFVVDGQRIAVFRQRDGALYATQDGCPHESGPLSEGLIGGCSVLCPLHSWKFDLGTGACLNHPEHRIRTYPVRAADGRVLVTLRRPEALLFRFESDLYPSLRCIPMAVRYKLDMVGLKVPLKAWNRLPVAWRQELLGGWPVETEGERAALRDALRSRLESVWTDPLPEIHPGDAAWEQPDRVPIDVAAEGERCRPLLTMEEWASLERLQRFALVKLATAKHERGRFGRALAEFRETYRAK